MPNNPSILYGEMELDASDKFDRLEIQQKNVTRELLDEGITNLIFLEKKLQIRGAVKKSVF